MSLNCLTITLTTGVILKEDKKPSLVGERQFGRHFRRYLGARVIASQRLSRDSGESIFAARHQDVSQGPLGSGEFKRLRCLESRDSNHGVARFEIPSGSNRAV